MSRSDLKAHQMASAGAVLYDPSRRGVPPVAGLHLLKSVTDARGPSPDGTAFRDRLGAAGPVLHFARDREIYGRGSDADVLFKVNSGVVRTCKLFSDGRRQVCAFLVQGDVFGF